MEGKNVKILAIEMDKKRPNLELEINFDLIIDDITFNGFQL